MSTLKLRSSGPGRLLCFDLENRPLAYWYDGETTSQITAFGWKWSDGKKAGTLLLDRDGNYVTSGGERWGTHEAHSHFAVVLASADLVYGHNIRRHDLPILNAWMLRLQLDPLPPLLTSDTLRDIPKRKGLSASLENLAAMYGLPGEKLTMRQPDWEHANQLSEDGVAKARERVVSDVLLQEALRGKLLGLGILKAPRLWCP